MASDLNLLLLGKTGAGKSALGNSILRRPGFNSGCGVSSVTNTVSMETCNFNGRTLRVVDTPGIGDTRSKSSEAEVKRSVDAVNEVMSICPGGYHALLFVVRFGSRYTQEDKECLEMLKIVFGQDMVQKHTILVITCGDNFQIEREQTGISFGAWVEQQTGGFKDLVIESQRRVVLFDNMTRDAGTKDAQLSELLSSVDRLGGHHGSCRYTASDFSRTALDRQRVIIKAEEPRICSEAMKEVNGISDELRHTLTSSNGTEPERLVSVLQVLLSKCELLNAKIRAQDKGTGALSEVMNMVEPTYRSVTDALSTQRRAAEAMVRLRREQAEMQRRAEEEWRREQEEMRQRAEQARLEEERRMEAERRAAQLRREEEERKSREREAELQRQLEREQEERRKQEEELRRVQARPRSRSRSPPVEQKVVREVGRVLGQVGRIFKW